MDLYIDAHHVWDRADGNIIGGISRWKSDSTTNWSDVQRRVASAISSEIPGNMYRPKCALVTENLKTSSLRAAFRFTCNDKDGVLILLWLNVAIVDP